MFLAAIVLESGKIFFHPQLDSFEDLIRLAKVKLVTGHEVVRVKYQPVEPWQSYRNYADPASYALTAQLATPDWYPEMRERVERTLRDIVMSCIVTEDEDLVIGPCIICPKVKVQKIIGKLVYAREANLSVADLERADCYEADLSGADLSDALLTTTNLSNATLYGANLHRAYLLAANLSRADLRKANLTDAYLSQANLFETSIFGANLTGQDMEDLKFRGALGVGVADV
jgi:hypothetical protein